MDEPKVAGPIGLGGIDAIHNLDAARLALRWALERIHSLEKSTSHLAEKAETESAARGKAETELDALRRKLALRAEETSEREAYYARMRDFVSVRLSGQPDAAQIAVRELELAQKQEQLHQKRVDLEKEAAAKEAAVEAEYHQLKLTLQSESQDQLQKLQQTLLERQSVFEGHFKSQREQLEREIQSFHDKVEAEVRLRVERERVITSERHQALTNSWAQEKASLTKEADVWLKASSAAEAAARLAQNTAEQLAVLDEVKSQAWARERSTLQASVAALSAQSDALTRRCQELEKQLTTSRAETQLTQSAAHQLVVSHDAAKRTSAMDKAALEEASATWRAKAEALGGGIMDLEKEMAQARGQAQEAGQTAAREQEFRAILERREQALAEDYDQRVRALESEYQKLAATLPHKRADLLALERVLAERFADLEKETHERDQAWQTREEDFRVRDRDWHEKLLKWQLLLDDKQTHLEDLKAELSKAIQRYSAPRPIGDAPIAPPKLSD